MSRLADLDIGAGMPQRVRARTFCTFIDTSARARCVGGAATASLPTPDYVRVSSRLLTASRTAAMILSTAALALLTPVVAAAWWRRSHPKADLNSPRPASTHRLLSQEILASGPRLPRGPRPARPAPTLAG